MSRMFDMLRARDAYAYIGNDSGGVDEDALCAGIDDEPRCAICNVQLTRDNEFDCRDCLRIICDECSIAHSDGDGALCLSCLRAYERQEVRG